MIIFEPLNMVVACGWMLLVVWYGLVQNSSIKCRDDLWLAATERKAPCDCFETLLNILNTTCI